MGMKAKDIAEIVGVSTATVSLVLNNKPGVGGERRLEIINKIKELGCEYLLKENPIHNGTVGFVVYKREGSIIDESPFFTYILGGINDSIKKYGYQLSFIYMNKEMTLLEQRQQIENANCKGLIIFAVEMFYDDLQVFKESGLPFTILDNSFQENDVDAVSINNIQGTWKAVQHLHLMGHTQIGYLKSKVQINSFKERYSAFKSQLKNLGLPFEKEYIIEVGYSEADVKKDVRAYAKEHKGSLPTAFIADNDLIGCSAVQAFKELEYHVPNDISVVGFDDRPICSVIEPALTTVGVPKDIFGPAAVDLLMSKMERNREQSLKIEVGTSLIIRDSVKKITK